MKSRVIRSLITKRKYVVTLYLFSWELNFAKMERAYFAGLNFHDLAKKYVKNVKNTLKTLKIRFRWSLIS